MHAKRRLAQRYDIWLTDRELEMLTLDIQEGRAKFDGKQSNRVTHWLMTIQGKPVRLVYDKMRKQIITVLPPNDATTTS